MRGDRPFAYDLVIEYGAVSGRVALLLRSAEAKPRFFTSVFFKQKLPIPGFSTEGSRRGGTELSPICRKLILRRPVEKTSASTLEVVRLIGRQVDERLVCGQLVSRPFYAPCRACKVTRILRSIDLVFRLPFEATQGSLNVRTRAAGFSHLLNRVS